MSTFYAAFHDAILAEGMARHLLEDGIALDRISLVTRRAPTPPDRDPSIGDASFFVGRADDPDHDLVDESTPEADYEASEISEIGGGISTSRIGQDVDSVDQMDESQRAAEDEAYPRDDTSHSRHQRDDLDEAMETGFPTPPTPIDNDFGAGSSEAGRSLEAVAVPGLGSVMGGGDLATAAFDWGGPGGEIDAANMLVYLQDEGVSPGPANQLLEALSDDGAILAVELDPGIDEGNLEALAQRFGADLLGAFAAPSY